MKQGGFTLVETLIGIFIFSLLSLSIYQGYLSILDLARVTREKSLSILLANEHVEWIRNLPYEEVGISGGLPAGSIPQTKIATSSRSVFTLTTTVRNIDQPFDGTIGGVPNDLSPADNKLVEVTAFCDNCRNFKPLTVTTTVAPKNLETASGNGALFVRVFDATGTPVPQASVNVQNASATPPININEVTDNNGWLQLVDVPPGNFAYQITVTKTGYSTAKTYTNDPGTNPNPAPPHSTVLAGQVTQISFVIDLLGQFNVKTETALCSAVPGTNFTLRGSKLIGTLPDIFKYNENKVTDGGGLLTLPGMEWDTYSFTLASASYDLVGTLPLLPVALAPGGTQDVALVLAAKSPRALMVTVKDNASGLPLSDATVTITDGGFSDSALTNRGFFRQTDWSSGSGQDLFVSTNRFASSDGNIDFDTQAGELTLRNVFGNYQPSGWLESSTFDTGGSQTSYYNFNWLPGTQPVDTGADSLKFQLATSNSTTSPWNYLGPDGTATTFYTSTSTNVYSGHNNERYVRYKVYLATASSTVTSNLSEVSVTYGTECLPFGQVLFSGLGIGTYTVDVSRTGYQAYHNDSVNVSADWQNLDIGLIP